MSGYDASGNPATPDPNTSSSTSYITGNPGDGGNAYIMVEMVNAEAKAFCLPPLLGRPLL